jgi:hypothetical protein
MKIAPTEQAHLRVLVAEEGRQERDRLRKEATRREAGVIERTTYLQLVTGKRELVLQLHHDGLKAADIARITGLPKRSIYRYLESVPSPSAYAVGGASAGEAFKSLPDISNAFVDTENAQEAFTAQVAVTEEPALVVTENQPRDGKQAAPAVARKDWRTAELAAGDDGWGGAWAWMWGEGAEPIEAVTAVDTLPAGAPGAETSNPQAALITPRMTGEELAQIVETWADLALCSWVEQKASRAPP